MMAEARPFDRAGVRVCLSAAHRMAMDGGSNSLKVNGFMTRPWVLVAFHLSSWTFKADSQPSSVYMRRQQPT